MHTDAIQDGQACIASVLSGALSERLACVQDLFYEDDSVLFIDMHQHEVWPGSGRVNEIGQGKGEGTTINVPMPGTATPRPGIRMSGGVTPVQKNRMQMYEGTCRMSKICC